jgi:hypothetical protein
MTNVTTIGSLGVPPHISSSSCSENSDTAAVVIPKGTCLAEWTPHIITPLYSNEREGEFQDPTCCFSALLTSLPRWKECSIWQQEQQQQEEDVDNNQSLGLWKSPTLRRFVKQTRQQFLPAENKTTTTSSDSLSVWKLLCLLTALQVTNTYVPECMNHHGSISSALPSTIPPGHEQHNHDNHDHEPVHDDLDDDELELLMEVWPLILQQQNQNQQQQYHIDWKTFCTLFQWIRQHLHMVTIPHPLTRYAQTTIFQLNHHENEIQWRILGSVQQQQQTINTSCFHLSTPLSSRPCQQQQQHRYRASQQWLDLVANLPDRVVGVLLKEPFSNIVVDETTDLPLRQSCLPTTCLELEKNSQKEIRCKWIALYDLPHNTIQHQHSNLIWTVSTKPSSPDCTCFRCRYRSDDELSIGVESVPQAARLAHFYFQRGELRHALQLYRQCHDRLSNCSTTPTTQQKQKELLMSWDKSLVIDSTVPAVTSSGAPNAACAITREAADMWHSIGAVLLTQLKFTQAQYHWRRGNHYQDYHVEIKEQLYKQQCYGYFDPLPSSTLIAANSLEQISPCSTLQSSTSVFVASNVVEETTCQKLIQSAMDFATSNGGWTTNRHYAVPTQDLPVHKVPKLLQWFQKWMRDVLFPLLHYQFFGVVDHHQQKEAHAGHLQRFYVHDAFLVRYEATSANNFLPLHYDESTHSCVVALNDDNDFEGGGTYIYDEDKTVTVSAGGMVSFRGNQTLHGGSPVTSGIRYILAIFLYLDDDTSTTPSDGMDSDGNSFKRKRVEEGNGETTSNGDGFTFSFF